MPSKKTPAIERQPAIKLVGVSDMTIGELEQLLNGDVVAFAMEDERPLPGLLGLWDWRLCGKISRLILEHHFSGRRGEQLLTIMREPDGRSCRLFLFGLGKLSAMEKEPLAAYTRSVQAVLEQAGAANYHLLLPASRLKKDLEEIFARSWTAENSN